MKKIKIFKIIIILLFGLNFSNIFSQTNCDGLPILNFIPTQLGSNNTDCSFSLTATSSRINNVCMTPPPISNLCVLNFPCLGSCYEFRLYLDNNILELACTVNNTHTFSGLSSTGSYRILIIYKRRVFCLPQIGGQKCEPMVDRADIVISATSLANVCGFIQSQHNSGQSAIVKREGNIEINCNIQNNKVTDLQASQKITALPGSSSGTGAGTYFHAKIDVCPPLRLSNTLPNGVENISPDAYVQKIINEFNNSQTINTSLEIYPNPNNGQFTIKTEDTNRNSLIEIYDLMGKVIWSKVVIEKETVIDITNNPKGIYLLKVTNENNVTVKKIFFN